jgi:hypothetical protein
MHHTLKIEEHFYEAKVLGLKPFEIRYNGDRGFQKGDTVNYTSTNGLINYEGMYEITYVTAYQQKENFVVFGDRKIDEGSQC